MNGVMAANAGPASAVVRGRSGAAADAASGASTLGEAAMPFVGWAKFGLDFLTFGAGLFACR